MPTPVPNRRWFRFRLRTLLIVVAVVAVPLAWIAKERRQSRHEVQVAVQLLEYGFVEAELSGPYDSLELSRVAKPQGWWRDLAREVIGERISQIAGPAFQDPNRWPLVSGFNDITPLAGLANVQTLYLRNSQVSDLTSLAGLTNLQLLVIYVTPVSDLTPLVSLRNLETLDIRGTRVSDLTPLIGLRKLRRVSLERSPVSKKQIEILQTALPNCKISHDPFP